MSAFRHSLSSGIAQARANPLEFVLIAVALAAIGLTIYETAVVALTGERTQDLTFSGTTGELGRALSASGTSRVGRLDRGIIVVGKRSVTVDTIVATADSLNEPAFATGGFIRDQIALYNDYAIRQALLASTESGRPTRARAEGPSLLRTVWSEDGTRRLSDRPNLYGLAIRSPYAEGLWREVRTSDWRSSPALLGYDGEVPLPANVLTGLFQARLNGHECNVNREAPQYYMYCQSALAADATRFYDFSFQVLPGAAGGSFGTAASYRQRSVWLNGRAETFGQRPVAGGDVFDIQALGPFVLSAAEWGTLAAEQWINGRRTFANPELGTLSFFAAAGRSITAAAGTATPVVLSFDAELAADLDRQTARFMAANERLLSRVVVVILDVRTGEVKAIAEPAHNGRRDDQPLLSFEPILVGSAVKPIMAAAILSRHPGLGELRIPYAGDTVTSVAGVELTRPFANGANGCTGEIDFNAFLRCSSNQYAAELMVRSLEEDGFKSQGRGSIVPRAVLERSAIATGLADVFDVDAYANRTPGRLALYWNPDGGGTAGAVAATTDRSLIPYESRPWILFPDSAGTRVDWVARYAFGGWENRWTLLGLAQAYARIATDYNVQATFLHRAAGVSTRSAPVYPAASPSASAAFAHVRAGLRQVGANGTAAGVSERLRAATKQPVVVLSKTGTLNESAAGGRLKSLVIALGLTASKDDEAPLTCGLVAVSYFEFADQRTMDAPRTALPRIHRDFAEGAFADVMSRHWSRMSGCASPTPAAGVAPLQRPGK